MSKKINLKSERPVYSARHANLRLLVAQHGTGKALSVKLGYAEDGSFISQLSSEPPVRRISEEVARKIESTLNLSSGWMDTTQKGGAT